MSGFMADWNDSLKVLDVKKWRYGPLTVLGCLLTVVGLRLVRRMRYSIERDNEIWK